MKLIRRAVFGAMLLVAAASVHVVNGLAPTQKLLKRIAAPAPLLKQPFKQTDKLIEQLPRKQTTLIVLPDGSECRFDAFKDEWLAAYACTSETDFAIDFPKYTEAAHFLMFDRLDNPDRGFWNQRTRITSMTLLDGTHCFPMERLQQTTRGDLAFKCDRADSEMSLYGDLRLEKNGVWVADLAIGHDGRGVFLPDTPILNITQENAPNSGFWDSWITNGMTLEEVEIALQGVGYEIIWQSEVNTDQLHWTTFIVQGAAWESFKSRDILVFDTHSPEGRLIYSNSLLSRWSELQPYPTVSGEATGWADINRDGRMELPLRIESGGQIGGWTELLQMDADGVRVLKFEGERDQYNSPQSYVDLDEDGILEVMAWDRTYEWLGGCRACGFFTDRVWVWDGERYVDGSAEFPHLYLPRINGLQVGLNTKTDLPHPLVEIFVLIDRLGQSEAAWQYLRDNWNHERWDDYYRPIYDNIAARFNQ